MRRMMTVSQLAEAFGVRPSRIHNTLKRTGMRWRLQKFKVQYGLSGEDVEQLAQILGKPTPTTFEDDSPALPFEWWGMPSPARCPPFVWHSDAPYRGSVGCHRQVAWPC